MHLAPQFLLVAAAAVLAASKASCHQQLPNYFTTNNRYNTPYGGPFYWDEYRLFGHDSRIGSYGYRYGNNNHRVEVNFHRPSVAVTGGNPAFNPSYQSPTAWPPYQGSSWMRPSSAGSGFGARPPLAGFAAGYPQGGFKSPYPAWRPTAPSSAPAYNYYWPSYYRGSPDQEYDINDLPQHSFHH